MLHFLLYLEALQVFSTINTLRVWWYCLPAGMGTSCPLFTNQVQGSGTAFVFACRLPCTAAKMSSCLLQQVYQFLASNPDPNRQNREFSGIWWRTGWRCDGCLKRTSWQSTCTWWETVKISLLLCHCIYYYFFTINLHIEMCSYASSRHIDTP